MNVPEHIVRTAALLLAQHAARGGKLSLNCLLAVLIAAQRWAPVRDALPQHWRRNCRHE